VSPNQTKGFQAIARAGARVEPSDEDIDAILHPHPGAPPFRSVGIVGVGLIGGSLALAARRAWPRTRIVGVDHGRALDAARLLVAFDALSEQLAVLRGTELVVLAAPVQQNAFVLRELSPLLDGTVLVTDVGSTKRAIVDAAAQLEPPLAFIGGHPLAGAAIGGLALARADLFEGRPWLLTPRVASGDAALQRLQTFVRGVGAMPHVIAAEEHDRVLAFLSHLPQLAATALMTTVGDAVGEQIDLAGPGLADTTRLASSPPAIWEQICATNADAIGPALDALVARLQALRERIDDPAAVRELFTKAQYWRERLG
jgi:prephenate dehydrogenase